MANPSENTPLLSAPEPTTDTSDIEASPATLSPTAPALARDHFKRPIRTLTTLILITSSIAVILAITNAIILGTAPFGSGRHFDLPQVIVLLGFFTFLSLVLSIINLRFEFPIFLNIIADAGLALYLTGWTIIGYELSFYGLCYSPMRLGCKEWMLVLRILMGVLVGLGGVVGVAHLILLVLRVIACFKVRFWERPFGLWFPTGELTVAVTIKVLRQQPPVERAEGEGALVQVISE